MVVLISSRLEVTVRVIGKLGRMTERIGYRGDLVEHRLVSKSSFLSQSIRTGEQVCVAVIRETLIASARIAAYTARGCAFNGHDQVCGGVSLKNPRLL
jgi:hypothetical protein